MDEEHADDGDGREFFHSFRSSTRLQTAITLPNESHPAKEPRKAFRIDCFDIIVYMMYGEY